VSTNDVKKAIKFASEKMVLELGIKMATQAKLLAPVDKGQLRNSISVATKDETGIELNKDQGEKAPPLKQESLKDSEIFVGSNVNHATDMEYGTKFVRARPFLTPAREIVVDGKNALEAMKEWNEKAMTMYGFRTSKAEGKK
jgi:phage gpG-like protein